MTSLALIAFAAVFYGCSDEDERGAGVRVTRELRDDGITVVQEYAPDASGSLVQHGRCAHVDEGGTILVEIWYTWGVKNGVATTWYGDGKVESVSSYQGGVLQGPQITWYPNGQIMEERWLVNGVTDGRFRYWSEGGQLTAEGTFVRGLESGLCRRWYDGGGLMSEREFVAGELSGDFKRWSKDGVLIEHSIWEDGERVTTLNPSSQPAP